MRLTFLGKDPHSRQTDCPSFFATDRGTYVVQGWRVTDPDALAALQERGMPGHETAVEIPAALFRFAPNRAEV